MFKCESARVGLCVCVCVCVCVVCLNAQETLVITKGFCSSVMVALLSVTCSCAIYKCVQWQMTSNCLYLGYLSSFSLAGTELFVLEQIVFPQREGLTCDPTKEGIRQRCQQVQWVEVGKSDEKGKIFFFQYRKDAVDSRWGGTQGCGENLVFW